MADEEVATAERTERRRTQTVRRLLANKPVEVGELAELDYEIHASWHLGLIATGSRAADALQAVQVKLGCRLLPAWPGDGTVWAWFGLPQQLPTSDIERYLPVDERTCDLLAIGGQRWGLDGWRQTHREARGALLRALRRQQRVVRYSDSPLLVAALENQTLATWLSELLEPIRCRPDGTELLKTLRAYLDAECNRSSAASVVQVRRQTVGDRLRLVEKLLGRPLHTCLAELDAALDLAQVWSSQLAPPNTAALSAPRPSCKSRSPSSVRGARLAQRPLTP
jgi:hypothetical protein